jgi:hypothetical protein
MMIWSRVLAVCLTLTLLLQTAEGLTGCEARAHPAAAMQDAPQHHHTGPGKYPGHQPTRHSCGPMDSAQCVSMSSCVAAGVPVASSVAFQPAPLTARPLGALADPPALRDITPESPPPRA